MAIRTTPGQLARDGAIDWWAAPAIDSTPVFAGVLDPAGDGCFTLEPAVHYSADRRYLPGTNVLETTFSTHALAGCHRHDVPAGSALGQVP